MLLGDKLLPLFFFLITQRALQQSMGLSVSVQINGALQTSALLYDTTSGHTSAQRQTESWSENTKEVHR